jgi:GTP-binding protein
MTSICFHSATFVLSAALLEHLPPDVGIEVAIAGRSNAGKSTLLNVLCNHKQLARVSKTPGRTQLINVFQLNETCRLIDLPGYGFAKVPLAIKRNWEKTLSEYLERRQALKGLVLLMDSRHPLKDLDLMMINWAVQSELPLHCVLTKADKLSRSAQVVTLKQVTEQLHHIDADLITVQLFSSLSKLGLDDLKKKMNVWFNPS